MNTNYNRVDSDLDDDELLSTDTIVIVDAEAADLIDDDVDEDDTSFVDDGTSGTRSMGGAVGTQHRH